MQQLQHTTHPCTQIEGDRVPDSRYTFAITYIHVSYVSSDPSGYRFDTTHTNLTFKYPFMKQPSSVLFRLAKGSTLDSIKILERNTPTLR